MKSIFLTLLLPITLLTTIPQQPLQAESYPLSPASQTHVALIASLGTLGGGILGYFISESVKETPQQPNESKDFISRLKAIEWKAVLLSAAVGAGLTGLWAYYNTPEKLLEWVEKQLSALQDNELFITAQRTEGLSNDQAMQTIKSHYFDAKYPAISSVKGLKTLNKSLKATRGYLIKVMNSLLTPLCEKSQTHLSYVTQFQNLLRNIIIHIKDKGGYLQELAVKEKIEVMQQMAESQRLMAQAAFANAHKPATTIINNIINK